MEHKGAQKGEGQVGWFEAVILQVHFLAGGRAGLWGEEGRRAVGGNDRRAGKTGGCVLGVRLDSFPSSGDVKPSNEKK